jgi:hypothetical protein
VAEHYLARVNLFIILGSQNIREGLLANGKIYTNLIIIVHLNAWRNHEIFGNVNRNNVIAEIW